MKISTILDHIDNGHMALPVFQRGYVWNRDQVRSLFDSLYKRHPVGGLLLWATESETADHRGEGELAPGVVKLILDGQQRMTSIYGVLKGKAPDFFEGNEEVFTGLRFHLEREEFSFFQPVIMRNDPLWIDITQLMQANTEEVGEFISEHGVANKFIGSLTRLLGIKDIEFNIEEVTGADKTLDVITDIFNLVNSRGTRLSKGDLALAKICAQWPDARDKMKSKIKEWANAGYKFDLDWLLRSVNTIVTGEAKFSYLHDRTAEEVQDGLGRASKHIDNILNMIASRLGLDHDRVFFGRPGVSVMARYMDQKNGSLDKIESDKLMFWFAQSGMWGRFSGTVEGRIKEDIDALEGSGGGLDSLIEKLRLWHGGNLKIEPGHFATWNIGARFYPVLYMLTRMGEACDWGNGSPLRENMLGNMNRLEVHHIFPKSRLYEYEDGREYDKTMVNALANFCFLTRDTNLFINNRFPEEYFPEIETNHPDALSSQWIPMDPELWKIKNYPDFLEQRRILLAEEANKHFENLLNSDIQWLTKVSVGSEDSKQVSEGGIPGESDEEKLESLNDWMMIQGLQRGEISYDYADPETGQQQAIFDIAWPSGIQSGLTVPVAVLLNEPQHVLEIAGAAGFRFFTDISAFQSYVERDILESNHDNN